MPASNLGSNISREMRLTSGRETHHSFPWHLLQIIFQFLNDSAPLPSLEPLSHCNPFVPSRNFHIKWTKCLAAPWTSAK